MGQIYQPPSSQVSDCSETGETLDLSCLVAHNKPLLPALYFWRVSIFLDIKGPHPFT